MSRLVEAVIEMPADTFFKYEIEEKNGNKILRLDRIINVRVPFNYGYFPGTLSLDGDPLDLFVIGTKEPLIPGTELEGRIVGGYQCIDNGESDDKLVIAIADDNRMVFDLDEITAYLTSYKPGFEILKSYTEVGAMVIHDQSVRRYRKQQIGNLKRL